MLCHSLKIKVKLSQNFVKESWSTRESSRHKAEARADGAGQTQSWHTRAANEFAIANDSSTYSV